MSDSGVGEGLLFGGQKKNPGEGDIVRICVAVSASEGRSWVDRRFVKHGSHLARTSGSQWAPK